MIGTPFICVHALIVNLVRTRILRERVWLDLSSYEKVMLTFKRDELVRPTLKKRRFRALFEQEITAIRCTYCYI
ncbi:hypothetical protein WH47_09713 [Habropoda laboriosa]|uniref:Uncharacterized protein n=1 Tax=Habropoda laboriosa TaxID=597456 RepID=A0A0L7QM85_9HYME|nr:hypothetical protein WH47_09713 [Habropoda laboriosa]